MTLIALPETHDAGRHIDTQAAERAAADLLAALGADLADEGLRETPRRSCSPPSAPTWPTRGYARRLAAWPPPTPSC